MKTLRVVSVAGLAACSFCLGVLFGDRIEDWVTGGWGRR